MIQERLREVRAKIDAACQRVGRGPREVRLIAVAKGQPVARLAEAVGAGVSDLGENYVQELLRHSSQLLALGSKPNAKSQPPRWHFIGHLQRNKVRQIIDTVSLIHSVDSPELAREIEKQAAKRSKVQPVLIEINLGDEGSKTGLTPDRVEPLVTELAGLSHLELKGLMAIPPPVDDPRPHFRQLREFRDALNRQSRYKEPLTDLSMGMTADFEVAIEEGATIVRIGTGIFGPRE